jgi:signal transduction histidine kinase
MGGDMQSIRFLLVEDMEADAELIRREVHKTFPSADFLLADNRETYLDALESFKPDVILSDYNLPNFDGLSALTIAKEQAPETPFILITGALSEETAVECMKAGAWDYILKERILRLGPAIASMLEKKRECLKRKEAERELVRAKVAAEAANLAKSEFLANMSHEIRTPLNGIMGMMQLMGSTALDEDQKEYIRLGETSAHRLTRLLSDILDLSSLDAGKLAIHEVEFRIEDICGSVEELFMLKVREKGVPLSCDLDSSIPSRLIGDVTRVRQILFNLVGNALKFTDQGRVRVNISALPPGRFGDVRLFFSISDTGIGIRDEMVKELFQPFVQADGSYTRAYQGAGLGLALVRRLVTLLRGNMCVENVPGQGTTMHVALPFRLPEGVSLQGVCRSEMAGKTARSLRVLVAEDDPLNQFMIAKLLERAGHEPILAGDGRQALNLLSQRDIDCILMDIQMPVMTGLEATRAIRTSPDFEAKRNIPIIAVTAHTLAGDRERFLDAGMDDYVPKPIDFESLTRALDRTIQRCELS